MLTDGTSVSVGTHALGALRHGGRLPFRGEGYLIPQRWEERQRNYGTDELVQLLVRSARRVNRIHPNGLLGIADLSPRSGGPTPEHLSHRSGRDVDLLFYSTDMAGRPLPPKEMVLFNELGISIAPASQPHSELKKPEQLPAAEPIIPRKLDVPRTWELFKALVSDPEVSVQWIFVGRPIGQMLLLYAKKKNEPAYIIERASAVFHQPSDAQTHMDHVHLRIFCPLSDRYLGCVDRGPGRWLKKDLKYLDSPPDSPPALPINIAQISLRPLRLLGL